MVTPMVDGEVREVWGSGSKPYVLRSIGGVHSCSCPDWTHQSKPIDKRSCKHLIKENGKDFEEARVNGTRGGSASALSVARPPEVPTAPREAHDDPATSADGPRANAHGGFVPFSDAEKAAIVAARERELGRKVRQDEKTKLFGPPVLLANKWSEDVDPTGWLESEKLDGVRAYWNGEVFVSRQGNVYAAPEWFTAALPKEPLDGELWIGRRQFQRTVSIVRRANGGSGWKDVRFMVFDAPSHPGGFEERLAHLKRLFGGGGAWAELHEHRVCDSKEGLTERLQSMSAQGAEGLMLRRPGSKYEGRRSSTLLKAKSFSDAEAVIIGHEPGKGRHKGRLGGLLVRMPDGKTFTVGTGLSDAQRNGPPAIGATITYRFTELTNDGIPKCASFVAVRDYE